MLKVFRFLAPFAFLAWVGGNIGSAGAAAVGRHDAKIVAVNQIVTAPAAGVQSTVTVDVGMSSQLRGAMALNRGSIRISDSGAVQFNALPAINFGAQTKSVCSPYYYGSTSGIDGLGNGSGAGCQTVGLTEADITAAADSNISANVAGVIASMSALVKDNGAVSGIYTFAQDLGTSALSGQRRLVWSLIIDPSGKAMYGQSKIVSTTQFYLYVAYTPLAVASGLPQSWQYNSPGTMAWMLVDSNMKALQTGSSIDTGGAFDEADGQIGSEVTLACLIDHTTTGCTSQFPDVVTLLGQSGASGAFVDYLHAVAPVYDNVETPPGSGTYNSVAELVLQVPDREVATQFDPTCLIKTYTYTTAGTYQFNLNHSMTRYFVNAGQTAYSAIAQMATTVKSPVQSYSMSLAVDEDTLTSLPSLYIDPFMQEGPLISIGDLPAGSSFADIDYLAAPACTPAVPTAPPAGP